MAIIGSVFALAGRFAGRVVNALLGWATILLFGRVEARRQTVLGFVVMGSLAWVGALVGVLIPDIGTFLVAAIPRPDLIDEGFVRLGMLIAVIAIPIVIGAVGMWMAKADSRPTGIGQVRAIFRGYPFTALLAFMMAFLAVVALLRKMNSLRRRWQDAHVPVIVKPGHYDELVDELADVLRASGIEVVAREAPGILSLPPRLLDRAAGRALGGMVPDHLTVLAGPALEILVYPSDVAISGEKVTLARARAAIASRLTEAPAWMTMSAEAQAIEDRLEAIARLETPSYRRRSLEVIDRVLARAAIPFDEWETLYRMRLQLDRDIPPDEPAAGPAPAPAPALPADLAPVPSSAAAGAASHHGEPAWKRAGRRFGTAVGAAGVMALLATDIAILVSRRDDTERRRAGRGPARRWLGLRSPRG